MRASEFIVEYKNYPAEDYHGLSFTMKEQDGILLVKALNDYGMPIGYVEFIMDGDELDSARLVGRRRFTWPRCCKSKCMIILKAAGLKYIVAGIKQMQVRAFWNKHRGEDVRVWESVDAKKVLQYIKSIHHDFHIDDTIMTHPKWELTRVPLNKLHVPDPESGEDLDDPYNRVQMIDMYHVDDITQRDIENKPIVVDTDGYIIDGNHRALAARLSGMKDIPAYIPVKVNENFAGNGSGTK